MYLLSRPRRTRRSHEWSAGKAVTFIVTLAATRSVTLAARDAGMSRKSAYALKASDPAFAAAWNEAVKARDEADLSMSKGDKVEEVEDALVSPGQGNSRTRATPAISSPARRRDALARDLLFAQLAQRATPSLRAALARK